MTNTENNNSEIFAEDLEIAEVQRMYEEDQGVPGWIRDDTCALCDSIVTCVRLGYENYLIKCNCGDLTKDTVDLQSQKWVYHKDINSAYYNKIEKGFVY